MLISCYKERIERRDEKHREILCFLAGEGYSTTAVIGKMLGATAYSGVQRTLRILEKTDYVRSGSVAGDRIWTLTPNGAAFAETYSAEGSAPARCYAPESIGVTTYRHTITKQEARIKAERAGWYDWVNTETRKGDELKPDFLITRVDGARVAVELEITIKSRARYRTLIFQHLGRIDKGDWQGVYYVTPNARTAAALSRMLKSIETLPGGITFGERARARFRVLDLADWPPELPSSKTSDHGDSNG